MKLKSGRSERSLKAVELKDLENDIIESLLNIWEVSIWQNHSAFWFRYSTNYSILPR